MSAEPGPSRRLGTGLCPWLREPFEQLERTRAAGRLGHGWLLAGPPGIGKLNFAMVMAERLLYADRGTVAELSCSMAKLAMRDRHEPGNRHPDLHWVFPEPDKHTISVEQIRDTSRALSLTSLAGRSKVVLLEPAEAMTLAAANALLKTLEEPAPDTYLFLISHQPGRLPATIRSRCQLLVLPRPSFPAAVTWLGEGNPTVTKADWIQLLSVADGAPLRAATLSSEEYVGRYQVLEDQLSLISSSSTDPQAVAEEWVKNDPEWALTWLTTRLQGAIRDRMAPQTPNSITDLGIDTLHNLWGTLTLGDLFQRLDDAEELVGRMSRGIKVNANLAVGVLLMSFRSQRGRT